MHGFLKQSTASQVRTIGPFIDDTDFKTASTGLTIANTDIRLKKNGANDVAKNSGGGTHDVNGLYHLTFDATDTDTIGELFFSVKVAGALQVFGTYHVLAANVYDSLFGAATDKLDVNVEEWNTTAVPAEHTAGYPIVTIKDGTGNGELDTASGVVLAKDHTGANLATASALDAVDNFVDTEVAAIKAVTDLLPDAGALTSLATQASVNIIDDFLDTEIAAIKAKTDNLPSDPADQSLVEAAITAAWTTALTESYAADGAAFTPAQALFQIWSAIAEIAISGTTMTCRKLDGSTTAMTFTLDSATDPTSRTRAT